MGERDDRPGWEGWEDSDDWFAEPGPERASARTEEIWIEDLPREPSARRRAASRLDRGRLALFGGGVVVVLFLLLRAAGVFGGGGTKPRSSPAAATQPATTTVPAPAPVHVLPPATTLAPGSSGLQVKRLQRGLARLGYSPGRIDGSYGPATVAALKQFQRATKLQPDGVLGPQTLLVLEARLAAR